MPLSALTGTKLRERRLTLGLKQAVVAESAGISASYLNLIEHNRRAVGPELLDRLGAALGLERTAFVPGSDALLFEGLRTAVARAGGDEAKGDLKISGGAELDRLGDFASRFPGWAALVVALDRRTEALERAVEALNDRMSHDPHLSQSLHELLSALASVRATAAILAETKDLAPDWSERFHRNLHQDSERLAVGAEALVAYLDAGSASAVQGIISPQDEVEDWLRTGDWGAGPAELRAGINGLASSAARSLAETHLAVIEADAALVPMADLPGSVAERGFDPFLLAERFACDPLIVMRRLTALPELGAGLVLCDASGTFTFRKAAIGFPLPRFGAACPIWPLYHALGHPLQPIEAVVEMAGQGGGRHRVFAWATARQPLGPRGPELRDAGMLILPGMAQLAPSSEARVIPVGSSCRVCPRSGCPGRREPSILTSDA